MTASVFIILLVSSESGQSIGSNMLFSKFYKRFFFLLRDRTVESVRKQREEDRGQQCSNGQKAELLQLPRSPYTMQDSVYGTGTGLGNSRLWASITVPKPIP